MWFLKCLEICPTLDYASTDIIVLHSPSFCPPNRRQLSLFPKFFATKIECLLLLSPDHPFHL